MTEKELNFTFKCRPIFSERTNMHKTYVTISEQIDSKWA